MMIVLHPLQKRILKSSIHILLTSYRSFRHLEIIFTISAVAPFLTGLQFITKTFISFNLYNSDLYFEQNTTIALIVQLYFH